MKPDWDKLMKEYADSTTVLVADVDCTSDGKPLCDANGVRGFPTIKHGDPADLQDYQGGRDFDSLSGFAKGLKPLCSPANIDLCDDEQTKKIEELQAMGADALNKAIEEGDEKIQDAEDTFKSEVEKLQKKYESLMSDKDSAIEAIKDSGLGLMKSVKAFMAKKAKDEL